MTVVVGDALAGALVVVTVQIFERAIGRCRAMAK